MAEPEIPPLPEELRRSIEAWENRKRYASFDIETLRGVEDQYLEQAVLDYIFASIGNDHHKTKQIVLGLSRGFQVVYISWIVEAEVMNGGFNQYFWNSSCQFAELTPAALRELGAPEAAALMEQALTVAIAEIPTMSKFRSQGTLEAFSESYKHTDLTDLDTPFCKLAEAFPKLRLEFIRNHEPLFVTE